MSCGTHLKFEVNSKKMSSDYLKVEFLSDLCDSENFRYRVTPFALNNEIFSCSIKNAEKLTQHNDVKTVYLLSFDLKNIRQDFLPGDTIGILPSNNKTVISKLFSRLNLTSVADSPCELQILKDTTKKNPIIPKHLPPKTTLREIFQNHVDIYTPPKKSFLKSLARFNQNPEDRAKLEQISSPKSSKEYTQLIATSGTLLKLLETFPSCQPPVEVLLEHLPPLQPRPYSISSSPLSGSLDITFFVLEHDDGRKGVCTGWLEDLILHENGEKVSFYFRKPTAFRLWREVSNPVILVATGTGIAPFRGFLQHLKLQGVGNGQVWLFYGCKYRDKDFLFKGEIEECVELGVLTKLEVAFSREKEEKDYVQHGVERNKSEFVEWVLHKEAKVFVCGDVKTVVKDVRTTVADILSKSGVDGDFLDGKGAFVVDTWT